MDFATTDEQIAYLEARIEALERLLESRSRQLRTIQRHLDGDGLLLVSRIASGLPPLPRRARDIELWRETTDLHPADVKETMEDLWRSLTPPLDPDAEA